MIFKSNIIDPIIGINKTENESFFEIMYTLHHQKLYLFASSYISTKEDVEEIIQDVFVKLWKNQNELSSIANLTGYIYAMTRNACLDFLRSKKNVLAIEINTLQQQNLINYHALSDDASSNLILKELELQIMLEVDKLPAKCKKVFIKSKLQGLKHKEIAQEMNISTKTIERHITKALKRLKASIKK